MVAVIAGVECFGHQQLGVQLEGAGLVGGAFEQAEQDCFGFGQIAGLEIFLSGVERGFDGFGRDGGVRRGLLVCLIGRRGVATGCQYNRNERSEYDGSLHDAHRTAQIVHAWRC